MYPRNAWYVACMPGEIDEKPLGRTVCGEHIVFFRGPEGRVAAVEDWCPHRGARLCAGEETGSVIGQAARAWARTGAL